MTISRSLSARLDRLTGRERRVLAAGAVASVLILAGTLVVAPLVGRWRAREAAIDVKAEQLARLEALVAGEEALAGSAETLRAARARRERSLLDGSTVALAGSSLQSLIRGYGERSRVSVQRMDPAGSAVAAAGATGATADTEDESSDLAPVALTLFARGDIYGLVDLLYYVQNGEKLLVVDELRVTAPAARGRDDLLSWSMRVRGFFDAGEGGP